MSELLYALKVAVVSFLIVILMQIRIGDQSIENHAHTWIQTAAPVLFLREVAEGGLAAVHDGWLKVTSNIKTRYWQKFDTEKAPGRRHIDIGIDRSQSYLEEQRVKKEKLDAAMAARAKKVKEAIGLDDEPPSTQEE